MLDPLLREQLAEAALLEGNRAAGLSNRVGIASGFSFLRFSSPMFADIAESG